MSRKDEESLAQFDTESILLILICVSVVAVLGIVCICVLYHFCKKYIFSRQDALSTYNESISDPSESQRKSHQLSPTNTSLPTVQNAVNNSTSNSYSRGKGKGTEESAGSLSKQAQTSKSPSQPLVAQPINKPRQSPPTVRLPIKQLASQPQGKIRTKKSPSSGQHSAILMDKTSITAEMFNPNHLATDRKEIVLFKAPSFTD